MAGSEKKGPSYVGSLHRELVRPRSNEKQIRLMIVDWFVHHKRFGRFKRLFDVPAPELRSLESFPRLLHFYWDQGLEAAPEVVRECLESWRAFNPTWTINVWDAESANRVVDRAALPKGLKTTPYSDIFRTCLLDDLGGVWIDATVMCKQPLDNWLLFVMAQCDFFAFRRPGPDREISSWFLVSRPGGRIIRELRKIVMGYWRRQVCPTRVYHWYHYLFEYLVRTSPSFRREWGKTPQLSAVPLILLQAHVANGTQPEDWEIDLFNAVPMHKLTYKRQQNLDHLKRVLRDAGARDSG
jgi:hypothetical protein